MPDFDIDFCQDRREEVIRYVQREIRPRHRWRRSSPSVRCRRAPRCATSAACWKCPTARSTRSASWCRTIRPIRRRWSKAIEEEPALQEEATKEPGGGAPARYRPEARGPVPPRLDPRRRHRHRRPAAARSWCRCIATRARDMPVTQFNMKWVEQAGLVKFDFLGLKTLTVLKVAVDFVAKTRHQRRPRRRSRSTTRQTYEMLVSRRNGRRVPGGKRRACARR